MCPYPQTPRYDSLKTLLSNILRYFLVQTDETGDTHDRASLLEVRKCKLQDYLDSFSRNMEDKDRLVAHGYSKDLWEKVGPREMVVGKRDSYCTGCLFDCQD